MKYEEYIAKCRRGEPVASEERMSALQGMEPSEISDVEHRVQVTCHSFCKENGMGQEKCSQLTNQILKCLEEPLIRMMERSAR